MCYQTYLLVNAAVPEAVISKFDFVRRVDADEAPGFSRRFGREWAYKLQLDWDCGCGFRMASHCSTNTKGDVRFHPLQAEDEEGDGNPSEPVFDLLAELIRLEIEPAIVNYWAPDGLTGLTSIDLRIAELDRAEFAILASHAVTFH